MKRLTLTLILLIGMLTEASAVLKEKDLNQTLTILQQELAQYKTELTTRSAIRKQQNKQIIQELVSAM